MNLRRLLWIGLTLLVLVPMVGLLVMSVTYKPYGVSDYQRPKYEEALRRIRMRKEVASVVVEGKSPQAFMEATTHDFGRVDPHATMSHSFTVENKGEAPLTVELGQTSCKCTVGKLAGGGLLLPGESTEVTLTWNTGLQAERYRQTAQLITNDPQRKLIQLAVSGTVRAELVGPESFAFGTGDLGDMIGSRGVFYSQLWDDFEIVSVNGDTEGLDWYTEPVNVSDAELAGTEAKSAWQLHLSRNISETGSFEGELTLVFQPSTGGELIEREVRFSGHSRKPISFVHPDLDSSSGLDIGTISQGAHHEYAILVRQRQELTRSLEVLDFEPKELKVSMESAGVDGVYRLVIQIPEDSPRLIFNRPDKRGYVQVGDPEDEKFQNWLPITGAVIEMQ
ncbi:hypothetical protein SV7mr_04720 [Stieleria bergensis]|uniref:DUF1573 domain-containing protein n=1 Tax=Stieleria bergensis TaxID=2528025 RepID=A0A517SPD0_9BACT|nr:hypothetical protein SV7mr_04720 [Planctomycetes bacterium SV_7m_r]